MKMKRKLESTLEHVVRNYCNSTDIEGCNECPFDMKDCYCIVNFLKDTIDRFEQEAEPLNFETIIPALLKDAIDKQNN